MMNKCISLCDIDKEHFHYVKHFYEIEKNWGYVVLVLVQIKYAIFRNDWNVLLFNVEKQIPIESDVVVFCDDHLWRKKLDFSIPFWENN